MSKKNEEIIDFEINGKKVKSIVKKNKDGTDKWVKFKPIDNTEGIKSGFHFIAGKPEEHHRDIYFYGKETNYKDRREKIKPAGVACVMTPKGRKFVTLPPLEVPIDELNKKTISERLHEYVTKVKINRIKEVKNDNKKKSQKSC